MTAQLIPHEMTTRLSSNERIRESLKSIIWFGSVRNQQDVHERSDFDVQVILGRPDAETILQLNVILKDYPDVDLSIMYMQDIYDRDGQVIFHDGTKSLFFMCILAAGEVLYGENIYVDIVQELSLDDIRPSLLMTIREYLSRLRVMASRDLDNTLGFKKYSLKMFKDILVYEGHEQYATMSGITNMHARNKIIELYGFSDDSTKSLKRIMDYTDNFTVEEMAALLNDYESIVEELCNE